MKTKSHSQQEKDKCMVSNIPKLKQYPTKALTVDSRKVNPADIFKEDRWRNNDLIKSKYSHGLVYTFPN